MKYFSAILLIFATILGIVACIIPFWSTGNKKQISSGVYTMNTGENMKAGLWGYCYDNIGQTMKGASGCHSFDTSSWPTSENAKGLIACRYLSIISIIFIAFSSIMYFFTQNKTTHITLCSLNLALITALLVVYYVVQQPLISSMHNNFSCDPGANCTGAATAAETAGNYSNMCTQTLNACQVCGIDAAEAADPEGQFPNVPSVHVFNNGTNTNKQYDIQNAPSCSSGDNCEEIVKIRTGAGAWKQSTSKCINGICSCPKGAAVHITGKRAQYCTNRTGDTPAGAGGIYAPWTVQAQNSDCTPIPGPCMYIQLGAAVLVLGSLLALPGLFSKKSPGVNK